MEDAGNLAAFAAADREHTAAGDRDFIALYEATFRPLWGYLQHASGRADIADDLAQETYCRYLLHRKPAMDAAATRSYLFRIATNLLHNRYRSRDDLARDNQDIAEPEESSGAPDQVTRLHVQAAMSQLNPRERQLLWLAYVEGMSHEEIAAVMGVGKMSVRILLFRARQKATTLLRPVRTQP